MFAYLFYSWFLAAAVPNKVTKKKTHPKLMPAKVPTATLKVFPDRSRDYLSWPTEDLPI